MNTRLHYPPPAPCTAANITTGATWDPACITFPNANASRKPPTLTTGTNAIWISPEQDNAVFANLTSAPLTTVAQVRAAVNNAANWTSNSILPGNAGAITLPSGQNFMGILLPVKLISFSATNKVIDIEINWKTADEVNLGHYEVQRSYNGRTFISIATINVTGGTGNKSYTYYDVDAFATGEQNIYYRLRSVDIDGKFSTSGVVLIRNKSSNATILIERLTNPFAGILQFNLTVAASQVVTARLLSADGRVVYTKNITALKGSNVITADNFEHLSTGIYILEVISANGDKEIKRIVKQ